MSIQDDAVKAIADETGIPTVLLDLGIQLVRRIAIHEQAPEAYLQTLLDAIEKDAQAKAKAKWG